MCPTSAPMSAPPEVRSADLRLAGVHLRLGQYAFARAELEALAVRGALDREALADLAEARWRTGDLPRAGEAAQAYLDAGGDRTVVLVVASEAAMVDGRPADARRLADAALQRGDDLDAIFAGLPRSRVWRAAGGAEEAAEAGGARSPEPATGDEQPEARPTRPAPPPSETGSASAHRLIAFAASALRDDRGRAAVELALVLRSEPSLAPAVLELLARNADGRASRSEASLEVVRGDAYRLIGRSREAEEAYRRAMAILGDLSGPPA